MICFPAWDRHTGVPAFQDKGLGSQVLRWVLIQVTATIKDHTPRCRPQRVLMGRCRDTPLNRRTGQAKCNPAKCPLVRCRPAKCPLVKCLVRCPAKCLVRCRCLAKCRLVHTLHSMATTPIQA